MLDLRLRRISRCAHMVTDRTQTPKIRYDIIDRARALLERSAKTQTSILTRALLCGPPAARQSTRQRTSTEHQKNCRHFTESPAGRRLNNS